MKSSILQCFFIFILSLLIMGFTNSHEIDKNSPSQESPQISGNSQNTNQQWETIPLLTIGEIDNHSNDLNAYKYNYRPVGILDGLGAFPINKRILRIFANHELYADQGYAYSLKNGTSLVGSRISYFDLDLKNKTIRSAGPAYNKIIDRNGSSVKSPKQINEGVKKSNKDGFDRLCSATAIQKETFGFEDNMFITGEESLAGLGGQAVVLDIENKTIYVTPMLGRATFENISPLETNTEDKVALLIGDDRKAAPLYLYIGQKNTKPSAGKYQPPEFLQRNGLGYGRLYVWVSNQDDQTPQHFNGTGNSRKGKFVLIRQYSIDLYDITDRYDDLGFASLKLQNERANQLNAFRFSRPEDIAVNPKKTTQAVFSSTGHAQFADNSDNWGTTYIIDVDFAGIKDKHVDEIFTIPADLKILYDGDDAGNGKFKHQDFGLRSPDNLEWANNGMIYIQEDDALLRFGKKSSIEASVWEIDPQTGSMQRVLEMDRSAVPRSQIDNDINDIGDWESSGILDISEYFDEEVLILTVQAHSLGGDALVDLAEGGQLLLMIKK